MSHRKKVAQRNPVPERAYRSAQAASRARPERLARQRRDDSSRRMVALGILAVGLLAALGVLMVNLAPAGGMSTDQMISKANSYYDNQKWSDAIPLYEKALQAVPTDTNVRTDLGTAYFYSGNVDKAKEHWFKVLEQDPNKAQTHFNLGVLYSSLKPPDLDAAAREWETVIKVAPNSDDAKQADEKLKSIGRR